MPIKSVLVATTSLDSRSVARLIPIVIGGSTALFAGAPASAQNVCSILPLGIIECPGGSTGGVDVTAATTPLTVTLGEGFNTTQSIVLGTVAGGDIVIDSLGDSTIATTDAPGLVANSTGAVTANVTNISTVGDGAIAAALTAADDIIFTSDGLITTTGDGADGVVLDGPSVDADLGIVRTLGSDADGVEIVAIDGPATLDFDTIETAGDLSQATILRGNGDVGLTGRALRTAGTDAVAFDISNDAAACVLLGTGGCERTVTLDEVTTEGFGGIGGLVTGTGPTTIDIRILQTGGDEAAGLDLSVDPAACVAIGVGSCAQAFTVDQLTTQGARSPGALARAAAPITANVGVLRTAGDEAAGLDLATEPGACVILGPGGCGTSFAVGELTTEGAGSTGALIRAAGPVTGDVGVLRTAGDDAAGIDIASDPTACVLLGAGACDVGLVADDVQTSGDGAAAILIAPAGNVLADFGRVATLGEGSTALSIISNPAACLALGPGSCAIQAAADDVTTEGPNSPGVVVDGGEDPVDVDAGNVDTGGDASPGVDVSGTGPIDVDADTVDTAGDDSPGIIVDGDDDPVTVSFDAVTTTGDGSPGVAVSGEGPIAVDGGTVTTGGAGSDGVNADGGVGLVAIDVDATTTTGADSDGVEVTSDAGDQTIVAGPVRVSGLGSDAISAVSAGCGDLSITARDDIVSTQGTGILASTACSVTVSTLGGAPVTGAVAGIDVTSGTGATLTIADAVSATAGPALDADGGAATVAVTPTGSIVGRFDLTDSADTLDNAGLLNLTGASSFGAGADALTNRGRIKVNQAVGIAELENLANSGMIDMVDAAPDDVLTLSGNFAGNTGSVLAIDVAAATAGTPADRLVVGGASTGATQVQLNLIGGPGVINPTGVVIADSGTTAAGAFTLAQPTNSGFVTYSLGQNAAGDVLLLALPNAAAVEPLLAQQIAASFWYHSADAWSEAAEERRGDLMAGSASRSGFWAQAYGGHERHGDPDRTLDVFGTPTLTNLRYETDRIGGQAGFDFGSGHTVFGVTGGYQKGDSDFASGSGLDFDGFNVGAYVLHASPSGFYAEALVKVDFFDGDFDGGLAGEVDGKSYGAEGEVGYRFASGGVNIDLGAGLAYVRTDLDSFTVAGSTFDYDVSDSLRGRIGARVSGSGAGLSPFADVKLLHEFAGNDEARFVSGGFSLPLSEDLGTSARGEIGLAGIAGSVRLSAWGELGDTRGYGLRAGIRF